MSLKRHPGATLIGYEGPHFPEPGITQLNYAFSTAGFTGAQLERILKPINGFTELTQGTSSDRYAWFWIAPFLVRGKRVALGFPWGTGRDAW